MYDFLRNGGQSSIYPITTGPEALKEMYVEIRKYGGRFDQILVGADTHLGDNDFIILTSFKNLDALTRSYQNKGMMKVDNDYRRLERGHDPSKDIK